MGIKWLGGYAGHETDPEYSENWQGGVKPTNADDVIFDSVGDGYACSQTAAVEWKSLVFNTSYTKAFTSNGYQIKTIGGSIDLSSGGNLIMTNSKLWVAGDGSLKFSTDATTVNFDGCTFQIDGDGDLDFGGRTDINYQTGSYCNTAGKTMSVKNADFFSGCIGQITLGTGILSGDDTGYSMLTVVVTTETTPFINNGVTIAGPLTQIVATFLNSSPLTVSVPGFNGDGYFIPLAAGTDDVIINQNSNNGSGIQTIIYNYSGEDIDITYNNNNYYCAPIPDQEGTASSNIILNIFNTSPDYGNSAFLRQDGTEVGGVQLNFSGNGTITCGSFSCKGITFTAADNFNILVDLPDSSSFYFEPENSPAFQKAHLIGGVNHVTIKYLGDVTLRRVTRPAPPGAFYVKGNCKVKVLDFVEGDWTGSIGSLLTFTGCSATYPNPANNDPFSWVGPLTEKINVSFVTVKNCDSSEGGRINAYDGTCINGLNNKNWLFTSPNIITTEDFIPQILIAGDFPRVNSEVTLLSGEKIAAGCVLGIVTASGKAKACDHTAVDGSQNPYCVAVEAADATAADVEHVPVSLTGEFNENKLTFGGTSTLADLKRAMRDVLIFAKAARTA